MCTCSCLVDISSLALDILSCSLALSVAIITVGTGVFSGSFLTWMFTNKEI